MTVQDASGKKRRRTAKTIMSLRRGIIVSSEPVVLLELYVLLTLAINISGQSTEQIMKLNSYLIKTLGMSAVAVVAGVGCGSPRTYDQDRPPTDSLVDGNTGIQAKDVSSATDHMASDLLALPELNTSTQKWTIVLTGVTNNTSDPTFGHYDVFADRLRPLLLAKGHGRVSLIENKAQYHAVQNQELEAPADAMGQGGGDPGHPIGIQPDYGLTIKIDEMPNRATSYFLVTATLTNMKTREQVWSNYPPYEMQAYR